MTQDPATAVPAEQHPSLTVADEMAEEIVRMKKMLHDLDHTQDSNSIGLVVVKSASNGSKGSAGSGSQYHDAVTATTPTLQSKPVVSTATAKTIAAKLSIKSSSDSDSDESRNDGGTGNITGRSVPKAVVHSSSTSVASTHNDGHSVASHATSTSKDKDKIRSRVLEATIDGARKQIATLKLQLKQEQEKNASNEVEQNELVVKYQNENEKLSKQLMVVQEQHKRMSSTHSNLMKQIDDSNCLNIDLNKQIQTLTTESLQLKVNDEATRESLKTARDEIDVLSDRYNHLRKKYESKEAKINALVDATVALKDEKTKLETKNERLHSKLQNNTKRTSNERSLFKDKTQKFSSEIKYWKDMNEQ